VGKDADVIVLDGPPLSVKTWVQRVYVNGELVYTK
jgi:imidazolonepropionase-like amidohydrolase